jgi:hypothetical protein
MRALLPLTLALLLAGCSRPTTPAPAPAEPTPPPAPASTPAPDGDALVQTAAAAKTLGVTLKEKLVSTMQAEGPVAAFEVCAGNAQGLTASVSQETGVTVGRSSLKLRNPANAAPDWVQAWLDANADQAGSEAVGFRRIDEVDGKRYARVLRPLPVAAPCLVCHGPKEGLAPDVAAGLASKYPQDQATGYAVGDLRGALYAEQELP